jgi:tetratricopeptide (TPR) repeat protein
MRITPFLPAILLPLCLSAQDPKGADALVREGIGLHDEGRYPQALAKYREALEQDSINFNALYEQSLTLFHMGDHAGCVELAERTLDLHGASDGVEQVYIALGNSLDLLGRPDDALKAYERGLAIAPGFFMLHFNRGITYSRLQRMDDAVESFKRSITLEPTHPGSHQALGRTMLMQGKRIPALLALSRFLFLEPSGARAESNLPLVRELLAGNVERNAKGGVTIRIDPGSLKEEADTLVREDDFGSVEMMVSMHAAIDVGALLEQELMKDGKGKGKRKRAKPTPEHELFVSRFELLIGTLEVLQDQNHGFFWEHYAPWFVHLKQRGHANTAAYLMQVSGGERAVTTWLEAERARVADMYDWDKAYLPDP